MGVITDFNPIGQNVRRQNLSPLDELMAQADLNAQAQQQAMQVQGAQGGQAIGGGVAPGGVRGGEGPPLLPPRGNEGVQPAFNNAMPTIDVWNGNSGVRQSASGAPATPLDAMRGIGGVDPGYVPHAGGGPVISGGAAPVGGAANPLDARASLVEQALNLRFGQGQPRGFGMNPQEAALLETGVNGAMQQATAHQRLGLDTTMQLGMAGPNGSQIPGAIANDAMRAHAALLQANNQRTAEDVAADQAAERAIQEIMRTQPGTSLQDAEGIYSRQGGRLPRRIGGNANNLSPLPGFMQPGGAAAPAPAGNATPIAGVQPAPAPGGANNAAGPPLPGVSNTGNRGNQPAPLQAIDAAFARGALNMPTPAQGQPAAPATPEQRNQAITDTLSAIPDDILRNNFPEVQRRLEQAHTPNAVNAWLNASNALGSRNTAQQAQIQRILRMAGMNQTPISMATDPANANILQRMMGSAFKPGGLVRNALDYWTQ